MIFKYFNKIYLVFFFFYLILFLGCQPKNEPINHSEQATLSNISFDYSIKYKKYVSSHRGLSGIYGYPE